jgi:hypothetical protein
VRLFLLFRFVLRSHSFQFAYDEEVKHENERKGDSEPQDEGVEGKGGLTGDMFALRPYDGAPHNLFRLHDLGVHDDGHHE